MVNIEHIKKIQHEIKTVAISKIGGGLGDVLQSTVIFKVFKKMFPNARMIWLGQYNPINDNIFKNLLEVDEYIEFFVPGQQISKEKAKEFYAKYSGKFDLIVDTQSKMYLPYWLKKLKPKYLLSRNPFFSDWKILGRVNKNCQVVQRILFLAKALGYSDYEIDPLINVPDECTVKAQELLGKCKKPSIAFIPSAGDMNKAWPSEHFAKLADMLIDKGYSVLLLGGDWDKKVLEEVKGKMKNKPIIPFDENPDLFLDPIYSAGFLKSCDLTVANDCGGLHLAVASGCPVIGIYGPTSPVKCGPLGANNSIFYKNYKCSPCKFGSCTENRKCLFNITPENVYDRIQEFFTENKE